MDRKQQVFAKLKLKSKALGFNTKELKGIAAKIADNLTSAEDASDKDANAEIDSQIDAVIPYLTFGQSQANRLLEEWKKNHPETEDDDDDDDTSEIIDKGQKSGSRKNQKDTSIKEKPEWAKDLTEIVLTLKNEVTALRGEKVTTSRRSKLEELLKDTGSFGARTLKSFNKMKFENDEEFEEFYADVENDLRTYNQERADNGLSTLGSIPNTTGGKKKETELLTDDEIIALAQGS